ncbi:MAG TPA: ion channel [Actinomycetota bacterium]|nr:ion channel [Actinomycetota bacterium]
MRRVPAPVPRPHAGMSLRERVRERDSYGVLLLLIVAALLVSSLSIGTVGSLLRSLTIGVALLFALWTSAASRREIVAALVLVAIAGVLSLPFEYGSRADRIVASGASVILAVGVLGAIARRVWAHPVVSTTTIAAALCAYLLVALAFAGAYGVVGAIDPGAAFDGTERFDGDGSPLDQTYFSFATLTTVGFGDISPRTDPIRIMAVTEAVTGQLYLVTVVAVLVGNLGRERRRRVDVEVPNVAPDDDGPRDDGPRDDGPRDDGPPDDGPLDDGPLDDGRGADADG